MSDRLKVWAENARPDLWGEVNPDPVYDEDHDMKLNDMYPSQSDFLKAEDLKGKPVKLIIASIRMEDLGDKTKPVMSFEGTNRELVLNKTNGQSIAAMYGEDSDDWMGKQITLYPTKVDFSGRQVDAIRVQVHFDEASEDVPF